jgi:NADH-quinone oxidoreductase subunit L
LVVVLAIYFIFMELAALRIYARVFLGQHVKQYHEIAYRSS